MDLEGWQEYERQQRAELEEQRQRLKSAIAAVTSGDKAAQAALEKAMMPEDEAGAATAKASGPILAAQIAAHERLLEEHRKSGTDPISVLSKRILEESSALAEAAKHPLLKEYVVLDKFASQKVKPDKDHEATSVPATERPAASGTRDQLELNIEKSLLLSEDAILEQMAAEYQAFDLEAVTGALAAPGIAHLGPKHTLKNALNDFSQAKSSDQVIEAAKT